MCRRFCNVYGIDMPTRAELVAYQRTRSEIAAVIGADRVIFQELEDLLESVLSCAPAGSKLNQFDTSVFDGMGGIGNAIDVHVCIA